MADARNCYCNKSVILNKAISYDTKLTHHTFVLNCLEPLLSVLWRILGEIYEDICRRNGAYSHMVTERSSGLTFATRLNDDTQIFEFDVRKSQYIEDLRPILPPGSVTVSHILNVLQAMFFFWWPYRNRKWGKPLRMVHSKT